MYGYVFGSVFVFAFVFAQAGRRPCNHGWVFSAQLLLSSVRLRMQSNRLLGGRRCEFACRRCEQLATLHCHRWELENILLLAKSAPEPLPPR